MYKYKLKLTRQGNQSQVDDTIIDGDYQIQRRRRHSLHKLVVLYNPSHYGFSLHSFAFKIEVVTKPEVEFGFDTWSSLSQYPHTAGHFLAGLTVCVRIHTSEEQWRDVIKRIALSRQAYLLSKSRPNSVQTFNWEANCISCDSRPTVQIM